MNVIQYKNDGSYHYWDTLIGPNKLPILRGADRGKGNNGYCWTAKPEGKNVAIRVWQAGRETAVPLDKVPDYVMAHIAHAIAIPD